MSAREHIPTGYQAVTPYLIVRGARQLVDFLEDVFGAKLIRAPHLREDGSFQHAELQIDDSMIMLADATETWQPVPAMLHVYVSDVDTCYAKALVQGATPVQEPRDSEDGDRRGGFADEGGNQWWIASRVNASIAKTTVKQRNV